MSAATSSRSCATSSRSRIALTRERKRKDVQAQRRARRRGARARRAGRRRRQPGDPRELPPQAARRRARRQGDRDRGAGRPAAACRCSRFPACRARRWARSIIGDMFGKAFGGRTKTRRVTVRESHELLIAEESDKLLDRSSSCRRRSRRSSRTASSSSTRSTRSPRREGRVGADVSREGVQRDLLPLIEGTTVATKHGAGEDRPHPVHRLGRLPRLEAVRPAARAAGPPADPRRAAARSRATISAAS